MKKSADAYRSIGEVAKLIGVAPHVLRYWETQFSQLSPAKRADGRRYYRLEDIWLAAGLVEALREEGLTTKGAARLIAADRGASMREKGRHRLPSYLSGNEGEDDDAEAATGAASEVAPSSPPDAAGLPSRPASPPHDDSRATSPTSPVQATLRAAPPPVPSAGAWLARLTAMSAILRGPAGNRFPPAAVSPLAERLRRISHAGR